MTHWELATRRREIADYVKANHTMAEAAAKFGCGLQLVYHSMREHGVGRPIAGMKRMKPKSFAILRELWDGAKPTELAKKYDLSLTSICDLRNLAIENGWPELAKK